MKYFALIGLLVIFSCETNSLESKPKNVELEINKLNYATPTWHYYKTVKRGDKKWFKGNIPNSYMSDIIDDANGRPIRYRWNFYVRHSNRSGKTLASQTVLTKNYTYVQFPSSPTLFKVEIVVNVGCLSNTGTFIPLGASFAFDVDIVD